ncbi:hypothetical protein [Polyangium sp. y55x31]|uniref:hypothetical protein n=1 Tax=Polyangium sp. y55x31 TaxID=3042688 RepID=UPI002482EBD6|nr:hypothetical protein [Polyangium sp. y55x31]MDI1481997.1 hypothetical protein [Polyangium sp. y55x31]
MSERVDSQVQQNRDVSSGRSALANVFEELAALETAGVAQIGVVFRGMARIGQASVLYGARVAAEWQRMALEATERAGDTFGAPFL